VISEIRDKRNSVEAATATLNLATKVDENSLRQEDLNLRNLDRLIDRMIDNYSADNEGTIEHGAG
jgi:hypothetical protein